jgi:hypothetical protein
LHNFKTLKNSSHKNCLIFLLTHSLQEVYITVHTFNTAKSAIILPLNNTSLLC